MKKLESSLKNMVVVLVLVALITGGLLAYVNQVTAGPIKAQADKALSDGIKVVMGGKDIKVAANDTIKRIIDNKSFTFVVHKVNDMNGTSLGAAVESTTQGFGGDLKILVGFDVKGDVLGYTILQSSETPGLGQKAGDWFQKTGKGSIIGMNPSKDNMTVKKDGGDVDAITASTITSRAFLKAINQGYQAYLGGEADGESGASKQQKN
jgi:electron transport complex protein RnfG